MAPDPAPSADARFVAIILGADSWPHMPTLSSSPAFMRSRNRIRRYLEDELHLIEGETLLDLFNSDLAVHDVDLRIREFLEKHVHNGSPNFTDIVVYYTGHGDFTKPDQRFQIVLRSTKMAQKDFTGYQMRFLASSLNEFARTARKLIILDCCYARAAFQDLQFFQSGDAIEEVVPEKIASETRSFPGEPGTILLCAASEDQWAFVPEYGSDEKEDNFLTMFTYGIANAIEKGRDDRGLYLNIEEIHQAACDIIISKFEKHYVKPLLETPKGDRQKLVNLPLFPNPAKRAVSGNLRLSEIQTAIAGMASQLQAITSRVSSLAQDVESIRSNSVPSASLADFDATQYLSPIPADLREFFQEESFDLSRIYLTDALIYWMRSVINSEKFGRFVFISSFLYATICSFTTQIPNIYYFSNLISPSNTVVTQLYFEIKQSMIAIGCIFLSCLVASLFFSTTFEEMNEQTLTSSVTSNDIKPLLRLRIPIKPHPSFWANVSQSLIASQAARASTFLTEATGEHLHKLFGKMIIRRWLYASLLATIVGLAILLASSNWRL